MGIVQQVTGAPASATGFTTSPVTTAQANVLALIVGRSGGAGTGALTGVTDEAGNTWTLATRGGVSGGSNTRCELWVTEQDVAALASQTISVTSASSQPSTYNIVEISDLDKTALVEAVSPDNSGAASATSHSTPAVSTSSDATLILSVINHTHNAAADTFDNAGGTQLTSVVNGTTFRTSAGYYETASAGSYDGDWTLPASAAAGLITAAFKMAVVEEPPPAPTYVSGIAVPSPTIRWHVCDSLTGRIVGRLNPNQWDITEEPRASSVGTLQLPMPGDPAAVNRLRNLIRPGDRRPHARAVAMEDSDTGKVLFYGPIVTPPQRSGPDISVQVNDWSAWFRRCVIRPSGATFTTISGRDYIATNRDQGLIMTDLFARALEATVGDPNIVIDTAPTTGVNRNLTAKLFAKVGEHLDEIANLSNGCEWYTYGTRNPGGTFILGHVAAAWPERGGGQIPVRLSYRQDLAGNHSGNVDAVGWPGTTDAAPTRVWATDGADPVVLYGWDQATTVGSVDIIWEDTIDLADGTTKKATATERAKGELQRVISFDGTVDITVNTARLPFAKLQVGDRTRLEIADGWNLVHLSAARIVKRVMSGGVGKPDVQTLTVDLDDNRFPFAGELPGRAINDNGVT